jgi:hypothetical protein
MLNVSSTFLRGEYLKNKSWCSHGSRDLERVQLTYGTIQGCPANPVGLCAPSDHIFWSQLMKRGHGILPLLISGNIRRSCSTTRRKLQHLAYRKDRHTSCNCHGSVNSNLTKTYTFQGFMKYLSYISFWIYFVLWTLTRKKN